LLRHFMTPFCNNL